MCKKGKASNVSTSLKSEARMFPCGGSDLSLKGWPTGVAEKRVRQHAPPRTSALYPPHPENVRVFSLITKPTFLPFMQAKDCLILFLCLFDTMQGIGS